MRRIPVEDMMLSLPCLAWLGGDLSLKIRPNGIADLGL